MSRGANFGALVLNLAAIVLVLMRKEDLWALPLFAGGAAREGEKK